LTYTPVKLGGHCFSIKSTLKIDFGCQTVTINEIKAALRQIKGENNIEKEDWFVTKNGGKLVKVNDIIEISTLFFITNQHKVIQIPDGGYELKSFDVDRNILTRASHYYNYSTKKEWIWKNNYWISGKDEDIIKKLEYVVSTYETLKNLKEQLQIK
jgi:hypothetical protein